MSGESENVEERVTMYPITLSVRITEEMSEELPIIAAFEQMKPSTLCRQELLKMIRRYQRNPQFKRWLKRMESVWSKKS